MTKTVSWMLALAGLAAALPVAVSGADAAKPKTSDAGRSCFWARNLDSWSAGADQSTVNLKVGVHDYYQLKLLGPCPEIDWTQTIGIESRGGGSWICSGLDVTLIMPRHGIGPERCPATSLRKLSREEAKALPPKQKP